MSDLKQLYQETILDHYKRPRNSGPLDPSTHHAEGHNPLCGDAITVRLRLLDDKVVEVRFEGSGCAISQASASMMTTAIKGKSRSEVEALFKEFHHLVAEESDGHYNQELLGKLVVFDGVKEFPMRVKCAVLAWHTLRAALDDGDAVVTTE
jgi:nitrogen fixation protein NifU and related proteins